jgi:hypothetical protein
MKTIMEWGMNVMAVRYDGLKCLACNVRAEEEERVVHRTWLLWLTGIFRFSSPLSVLVIRLLGNHSCVETLKLI